MKKFIYLNVLVVLLSVSTALASSNSPIITVSSPADATTTTSDNINVYGTASSAAGISNVTVNGINSGDASWSNNVALFLGSNSILIVAGNWNGETTQEVVNVTRTESDTTPPVIDNISPTNGFYTTDPSISMIISASDNVGSINLKVNGVNGTYWGDGIWHYSADLNLGTNTMTVVATDTAGNQSTQYINYIQNSSNVTRYVNLNNNSPLEPYISWTTAATNIQNAIDISNNGNTIIVTNGIYSAYGELPTNETVKNIIMINKTLMVKSVNGPAATIIMGSGKPSDNIRCAYLSANAQLSGFTLTNGYTSATGGGVFLENAIISNCVVSGNTANSIGGGLNCMEYGGIVKNCIIIGNSLNDPNISAGGGMNCYYTKVYNSTITRNTAQQSGGVSSYQSEFYNCIITDNSAKNNIGGIKSTEDIIYNSIITGNSASNYAGIDCIGSIVQNCTISDNTAIYSYGGMFYSPESTIINTIIYFNNAQIISDCNSSPTLSYCCSPNLSGNNNVSGTPMFANTNSSNFRLQLGSSCINTGINMDWMPLATDLDGNDRIINSVVDIGAYEFSGSADTTPPTIDNISPADGYSTNKTSLIMEIEASDDVGVASVTVNDNNANLNSNIWNYTATLDPGLNQKTVIASDAAGNQTTQIVDYIFISPTDTNAPNLVVSAPTDWTTTTENNINVYGTADDPSGVLQVTVNEVNAGTTSWFRNVALAIGTNSITIVATDSLSNQTIEARNVIRNSTSDTTPPTIDNISPADGYTTTNLSINMEIEASDNIEVTSITINGENANFNSTIWNYSATLNLGINSMEIIVEDAAGNQSTQIVDYTRNNPPDVTPPTIGNISPDDGYSTINSNVNMTIEVQDNVGVVSVTVNGADATFDGGNSWNYTAILNPGGNTIIVIATDAVGNQTTQLILYIYTSENLLITTTSEELKGYSGHTYGKKLMLNRDRDDTDFWTIRGLPSQTELFYTPEGIILGVPSEANIFNITATITNLVSGQSTFTNLTIIITGEVNEPTLLNNITVDGIANQPYNVPLQIAGIDNPIDWIFHVVSGMPAGMSLTPNGRLEGTPSDPGSYEIAVAISNKSPIAKHSTSASQLIEDTILFNVADIDNDKLTSIDVNKTTIRVNWKEHARGNSDDKIIAKLSFVPPEQDYNLTNGHWSINIGNYPVPLTIIKSSKNGRAVKFFNSPENKTDLTIKGKAVLDKFGNIKTIVKIKNADVATIYGLKSDEEAQNLNYLPLKFNIGINLGHAILPMSGKTKIDKKTILKLRK